MVKALVSFDSLFLPPFPQFRTTVIQEFLDVTLSYGTNQIALKYCLCCLQLGGSLWLLLIINKLHQSSSVEPITSTWWFTICKYLFPATVMKLHSVTIMVRWLFLWGRTMHIWLRILLSTYFSITYVVHKWHFDKFRSHHGMVPSSIVGHTTSRNVVLAKHEDLSCHTLAETDMSVHCGMDFIRHKRFQLLHAVTWSN